MQCNVHTACMSSFEIAVVDGAEKLRSPNPPRTLLLLGAPILTFVFLPYITFPVNIIVISQRSL